MMEGLPEPPYQALYFTPFHCAGFGGAIGVHFIVGYLDPFHLLPAMIGFIFFLCADVLLWIGWRKHLVATMGQLDSGSITP